MSWHFSAALAAEFSEAYSADGELSSPSSLPPTAGESSCNDKTTESSSHSQFGTISKLSTGDRGLDAWISSLEGSRAKTSVRPEKAPGSTEPSQDSGARWQGSFAKWDRAMCSWRIPQSLLPEDFSVFSGTWPRWGMMRDAECWELKTPSGLLAIRSWITSESASGFWRRMPTPTVQDAHGRDRHNQKDGSVILSLLEECRRLPTPTSSMMTIQDMEQSAFADNDLNRPKYSECLRLQTPVADDAVARTQGKINSRGEPKLSAQVKRMPTATARDYRTGDKPDSPRARAKQSGDWHSPNLNDVAAPGGQLNPDWTEWLQGFPIGWSALEPLAIARFLEWLDSHGRF